MKQYLESYLNRFFLVFFTAFLIISLLGFNSHWVTAFISLPLIFLYPGYYATRFWRFTLPGGMRLSLSVVFSLGIHLAFLTILKRFIPLDAEPLSIYLLTLNAAIAAIFWIFFAHKQQPDTLPYTKIDYLIASIPFIFFLINFGISPLVSEGDSYYFIYSALDSFKAGHDISPYVNRPGFIPFLGLLHLAGGESFVLIFRFLLPILFYISALMIFDHAKKYSKNYDFSRWIYLTLLAAPVVTTEVDIVRTQSLIFIFTIPILILLSSALAQRKFPYLMAAALLAAVGTRIHELSYVLLATCLASGMAFGVVYFLNLPDRRKAGIQLLKILGVCALIAYPYLELLSRDASFFFIENSSRAILTTLFNHHWTWWFLSSYTSDGWQVGWSGAQAILYYLYNGILLLAATFVLMVATKKTFRWALILPPLIFTFVYFTVAEILPRIGLFYYPNRAWPHLMIGFTVLLLSATTDIRWRTRWIKTLTQLALVMAVIAGLIGWIRLTADKGGFYMKQEISLRNFIRDSLPGNAVLYTAQSSNQAMVNIYAEKQTIYIPYQTIFSDPATILKTASDSQVQQEQARADSAPYLKRTIVETRTGVVISNDTEILPPDIISVSEPTKPTGPLYFYYSFARFNGYMGQRDWWRQVNSYQNYDFFKNFPDQNVVYRDEAGIIIKL